MKLLFELLLIAAVTSISLSPESAQAQADAASKEKARKVFVENSPKIFGLKSLVQVEIVMEGRQAGNSDSNTFSIATAISDNILLCSYRSIKPSPNISRLRRAQLGNVKINTEVKEIKVVDESGEEFDARLVLHDEDLDLAFVAIDKKAENYDSWSCQPVDISQDVELEHLDDIAFLGRSETLRMQPSVRIDQIHTIIPRPRRHYITSSPVLSGAAFSVDGKFVGLGTRKKSSSGSEYTAVLPSKYIRTFLPQAIEQAEKAASEAAEEEDGDSDDGTDEKSDDDKEENEGETDSSEKASSEAGDATSEPKQEESGGE